MTTTEVTEQFLATLPDGFFNGHVPDACRAWEITEDNHPDLLRVVARFGEDVAVGTYAQLLPGLDLMAMIPDACNNHDHPDVVAADACYHRITGLMDAITTAEAVGGDPRVAGEAYTQNLISAGLFDDGSPAANGEA